MYPYICKYGKFPVGAPEVKVYEPGSFLHREEVERWNKYPDKIPVGVVKVKVLPPRNLFHPVLPHRSNGKLCFPLCRICCDKQNPEPACDHTDDERSLTAEFVAEELTKAVKCGYRVLNIGEVWRYNESTQYDRETKSGGLFSEYINAFYKLKTKADGWPSWVKTEADKDRYIEIIEQREGITVDRESVEKRNALRTIAKLMLNRY